MAKRRCRECGEQYEEEFRRCPACGAEAGKRIPRCRSCGSRLTIVQKGRCPVCGEPLRRWDWLPPLLQALAIVAVMLFLGATYVYSYVPQLGLATPVWPTSTHTATIISQTPSATPTAVPPTPTRTRTPTFTRVPPTATKPPPVTYVVQYGDSLWGISDKFNVSIEALLIANGLAENDIIREEQIMIIPTGTPTPPVVPSATPRPAAPVTRLPIPTSTPKP